MYYLIKVLFVLILFTLLPHSSHSQVFSAYLYDQLRDKYEFTLSDLDAKQSLCTYTYDDKTDGERLTIKQISDDTPFYVQIISTSGTETRFLIKEKLKSNNRNTPEAVRTRVVGQGTIKLKSVLNPSIENQNYKACKLCKRWVGMLTYHYSSDDNQQVFVVNATKHFSRVGIISID